MGITYILSLSGLDKFDLVFNNLVSVDLQIMLNYIKDMFRVYEDKPKFMFAFHGELSHDFSNKVSVSENDLVEWLEWFEKSGYLNNTMLVFMSDHGQRYNKKINPI